MNKGQSLFEVLVAVSIIALILVGVVSLSSRTVSVSRVSRDNSLATGHAQDAMEWLRTQRDEDWANLKDNLGNSCINTLGTWGSFPCSSTITGTPFSREVNINETSPGIMVVTVTVRWTDGSGSHNVTSTTRFTDWR